METVEYYDTRGKLTNLNASEYGWTPLICASYYGYVELVKLLLAAGAKMENFPPVAIPL